jgi:hypothetical protein
VTSETAVKQVENIEQSNVNNTIVTGNNNNDSITNQDTVQETVDDTVDDTVMVTDLSNVNIVTA